MIKYCIPTNFDDRLIGSAAELNNSSKNIVYEFYGSLKETITGTGRPAIILNNIKIQKLKKYIQKCHSRKIKFNFLLNGACMGAKEFDSVYLHKILTLVKFLEDSGADILTITNPYLIAVIKNRFPKIKICLSVIAGVNSLQEIKIYEKMGVCRIVLDPNINRNFETLRYVRNHTNIELELLANNPCLLKCPFMRYHYEINSHISIKKEENPAFPSVICKNIRLKNLEEIIKSPWIRPSDAHRYADLGINYIKLAGRERSFEWILNAVKHYIKEQDGANFYQFIEKTGWKFFQEKNKDLKDLNVSIPFLPENFLDFFEQRKECGIKCEACGYCKKVAEKYIRINNQDIREKYLKEISSVIKNSIKAS
ncbi:MAG: U32 family peptidase [Patescibacteria group bacterium]